MPDTLLEKFASIVGEFWIDDTGNALFADGDVGDFNHEMYIKDLLMRNVLGELLGEDVDEPKSFYLEDYFDQISSALNLDEEEERLLRSKPITFLSGILAGKVEDAEEAIRILFDKSDPNLYAMKHWRWKRVHGNNIQTYYLTKDDLRIIRNGLYDLLGDLDYDDPDASSETINIEVVSTRKFYTDVPLDVIENLDISELRNYE